MSLHSIILRFHILFHPESNRAVQRAEESLKEEKQPDFMNIPDGVQEQMEFDTDPKENMEPQMESKQKSVEIPKTVFFM